MSRRNQIYLLAGLLAVLAAVIYFWLRPSELATVSSADEKFQPLNVENPSLRLDLLERIRKLDYSGTHRNIFSASRPAPPPAETKKDQPQVPPPPPPLQVPFKFYGYATDPLTGKRRAFFTNGEEVFIAAEGEMLQNQYRVLRIGNTTVDVEEVSSGRRTTLTLEQAPGPQG